MTELHWSPAVVGVPKPDGLEIWNTSSGVRLKLPANKGKVLPDLKDLSGQAIDRLHKEGMIQRKPDLNAPLGPKREGVLGVPATSLAQALGRTPAPDIVVLGAAVDIGAASNPGARHAPEVLRRFSSRLLASADDDGRIKDVFDPAYGPSPLIGKAVLDIGDLFAAPSDPRQSRSKIYSAIEATVQSIVCNAVLPLLLGGDHSVTAPAYLAVSDYRPTALVVFDAHLDAEESGITRFEELTHVNFLSQILALRPSTEVYVLGVREPVGANLWPLPDRLKCFNLSKGLAFLKTLPPTDLYLSVDVDVLDPSFFPATGHPVPGGLSVSELTQAIDEIGSHHRVVAADLVEAMHSREHDYTTGQVGGYVVRNLLEALAQQRTAQ